MTGSNERLFLVIHIKGIVIQNMIWILEEKKNHHKVLKIIIFELEKNVDTILFPLGFLQIRIPICWRAATIIITNEVQTENYQYRTKGRGPKDMQATLTLLVACST